ncbi:MAG: AI-2E family transporter [Elusimicrobia bacterium]|nr:AI-2E family transporter [Elusimicrobiota bacterium]
MTGDRIGGAFFAAVLLFVLYQAARMLAPFFGPILCAIAAAIVCYPIHAWISRRLKSRGASLRALISLCVIWLFAVVPLTFMIRSMAVETQAALPEVKTATQSLVAKVSAFQTQPSNWRDRLPARIAERLDAGAIHLGEKLASVSEVLLGIVAGGAAGLAMNILDFAFDFSIFLLVLFFLLRDGPDMVRQLQDVLPLSTALKGRLAERIKDTVEGVVRGAVIVGLAQGFVAMVGFLVVGARAAILLGCLTAVASLVPAVGTAMVWVPVSLGYLVTGSLWKGVFLIVWGLLISTVDSVLRPMVVGSKADIPFLWLTLSLLGGIQAFGIKGLILGPLTFAILPILLDIFKASLSPKADI